jgi:hypothetical protein
MRESKNANGNGDIWQTKIQQMSYQNLSTEVDNVIDKLTDKNHQVLAKLKQKCSTQEVKLQVLRSNTD